MPHVPTWHTLPHTGLVVRDYLVCVLLSLNLILLKVMVRFIFYVPLHTLCDYAHSAITHRPDYTHSATVHTLSFTFGVHVRVWPSVSHTVWLSHDDICECLHQTDNGLVVRYWHTYTRFSCPTYVSVHDRTNGSVSDIGIRACDRLGHTRFGCQTLAYVNEKTEARSARLSEVGTCFHERLNNTSVVRRWHMWRFSCVAC